MPTWTPGPWKVGLADEHEHQAAFGPDGYMVADCAIFGFGAPPDNICTANARLIAEAPEMFRLLDTLALWVAVNMPGEVDGPLITKARETLARARGETP